jgi:hypothetical protein
MAVPTTITDLSATAGDNSPAGTESVLPNLDNYLRAHASFIRQTYDAALSKTAGGTVSAATSFTGGLTVSNTLAVSATTTVTGATTFSGATAMGASATATTPAVTSDSTALATTAFVRDIIPAGVILLWSGSVASIPTGWLLCNGSNGTPDLRDRFVVGAGSAYAVAATGGSANAVNVSHTHTATSVVTDPGHVHGGVPQLVGDIDRGDQASSFSIDATSNTASATTGVTVATSISTEGSSGTNANLPPYYALAYIQKA